MHYQEITSVHNPQVKAWRALRDKRAREDCGCFMVVGIKMTGEAAQHARVRSVLFEQDAMDKISGALLEQLEAQGAQLFCVS